LSPGRRTNRKNLRSCQRTILLYSFYFFRQRKMHACKYTCFQSSARRSQPRDRKWCKPLDQAFAEAASAAALRSIDRGKSIFLAKEKIDTGLLKSRTSRSRQGVSKDLFTTGGHGGAQGKNWISTRLEFSHLPVAYWIRPCRKVRRRW
jgi:hypothetical protein